MNALIVNLRNVEKRLGAKGILTVPSLNIYEHERIGIIGNNGVGKTTLLNLISGKLLPDKGKIQRQVAFAYYEQISLSDSTNAPLDKELLSRFRVPKVASSKFSGGESAKLRLTQTLSAYEPGLLLDEPTSHLDGNGVNLLVEELRYYYGTLVVVSHDRYFLDQFATKIWEVANGKVTEYPGNYTKYLALKKAEDAQQQRRATDYLKEKKQLKQALQKKQQQVTRLKHVTAKQKKRNIQPNRLASSKQKDTVQKGMQKTAKVIEGKLKRLEVVTKPDQISKVRFTLPQTLELHNSYPVMGDKVTVMRGNRTLLKDASFQFANGQKIAVIGQNGVGKTTLFEQILENQAGIILSPKVVFSAYQQLDYQLDSDWSLLRFIEKRSDYSEQMIRSVFHQLGFGQEELLKPVGELSGGEKVKVALAVVFLRPANVLILDEPTNFLDLATIVALEKLIRAYPGMVIFTSHDRYFVKASATVIYRIVDKKLNLVESTDTEAY